MTADDTTEGKGFTVNDKRRFTSSGDPRGGRESPEPEAGDAPTGEAAQEISFSGFVIGLAQQAFVALGLVPSPDGTGVRKDLVQAKAMIDVLAMLRDKTRGNLEETEARMMEDVLDELRLRYVREHREMHKQGEKA